MDDRELKLRLFEAAVQLPGVRIGTDPTEQAERAREVVRVWYNEVNGNAGARVAQKTRRR